MPSALERSRELLARSVAGIRSGLNEYERRTKSPGPEIAVAPFDAQNVSTPAALIKLGTSIAAARRQKANFDAAQEGIGLEREKTRAEIARLRAAASYDLGEGRQTEKATPAGGQVLSQGRFKGMTVADANAILADERNKGQAADREDRRNRRSRVAGARAGLQQVEQQAARDTQVGVTNAMANYEGHFRSLMSPDPAVRRAAASTVGIDPQWWEENRKLDVSETVSRAREGLRSRAIERAKSVAGRRHQVARARYQGIINEDIGFDEVVNYVLDESGNYVPAGP